MHKDNKAWLAVFFPYIHCVHPIGSNMGPSNGPNLGYPHMCLGVHVATKEASLGCPWLSHMNPMADASRVEVWHQ